MKELRRWLRFKKENSAPTISGTFTWVNCLPLARVRELVATDPCLFEASDDDGGLSSPSPHGLTCEITEPTIGRDADPQIVCLELGLSVDDGDLEPLGELTNLVRFLDR